MDKDVLNVLILARDELCDIHDIIWANSTKGNEEILSATHNRMVVLREKINSTIENIQAAD